VPKVVPHFFAKWPKGSPTGKFVPSKRPIDPQDHNKKENIGGGKMNESNDTK
tara:strand:- start:205 stop:360 length:156 start_codon:yes stop_codon:yes gene_type:complete